MEGIDHFAFEVADMDTAIAFYTEKLGLKLMFRKVDEEQGEEFALLELEGGNLELLRSLAPPAARAKPEPASPWCPHLALVAEDMDELVARAKESGIAILDGPLHAEGLAKWIYLSDPDGNIIEYIQWLDGR